MSKISMSDQGVTWKMVPVEPTSEHITEGSRSLRDSFGNPNQWARAKGVWDAIIASIPDQAAPAPPPLPSEKEIATTIAKVRFFKEYGEELEEQFVEGMAAKCASEARAILTLLNRGR